MSRRKTFTEEEKQAIIEGYDSGSMTAKELGVKYGTSDVTILKNLREWNVTIKSRKLDITGLEVGDLTVLRPAAKRDDKYTRWVCQCSCGKITEVRTDYLTSGHTRSCGHRKELFFSPAEIDGEEFGRLTVLYHINGGSKMCLCECGNEVQVLTGNLLNGNTQSCGCLKSKGELKINSLLNEMNIDFKTQYSPEDFRFSETGGKGYFDYAILKDGKVSMLIEYDGLQHFIGWNGNEDSLVKIKKKDREKTDYCSEKGIRLIRIPYTMYDKIDKDFLTQLMEEEEI